MTSVWTVEVDLVDDWLATLDEKSYELVVAGDKAGNWQKWYRTNIPLADERYRQHLDRLKGERNAQDS